MNLKVKKLLIQIIPSLIIGTIVSISMILHGISWPEIIFAFIRWTAIGLVMTYIGLKGGWIDATLVLLFVILDYYSTLALQLHWFGYFDSIFNGGLLILCGPKYIDTDKQKRINEMLNIFMCLPLAVFFFLQFFAPQYTIEIGVTKSVTLALIFRNIKTNISYFLADKLLK